MALDIEQVVEEHLPRIYRAALLLCGDPWEADDLAQEVFLVAARRRESFSGQCAVYTWLYGILLNLNRRRHRRQRRAPAQLEPLTQHQPAPATASPLERAESQEFRHTLWALVSRLPQHQREVIVLRFSEQLKYEEIAQVLGCPVGTVKSRLFYALRTMRQWLDQDFPEHTSPTNTSPASQEIGRAG